MPMKIAGRILYCLLSGICFFAFLCASARPALAYVDPGSGLLLYQITGSLLTGFLFVCRKRLRRMLGFLSGLVKGRANRENGAGEQRTMESEHVPED